MAIKPKKYKSSLQETIALLDDPAPKDFDPEALELREDDLAAEKEGNDSDNSDEDESENENAGREHYVAVGRSKLRKAADMTLLDPKYDGSKVRRSALEDEGTGEEDSESVEGDESGSEEESEDDDDDSEMDLSKMEINSEDDEEIDSDMAMGDSDEEKYSKFTFKGSATTKGGIVPKRGHKVTGSSDEEMSDGSEGSEDEEMNGSSDEDSESAVTSDSESDSDSEEKERREELKKMISEEQKAVVSNVSKAVRADIEKGFAVKKQQSTFDGLLGARIKMQKALIAANSIPATEDALDGHDSLQAAEEAVLKLWNMVSDMRAELQKLEDDKSEKTSKRKRNFAEYGADISDMWLEMDKYEKAIQDTRESTLEKWWSKTQGVSTIQLNQKLNNKAVSNSITGQLNETLNNTERLVKRTRIPRSCAPVQSAKEVEEDAEIFDDTDFYQLLLKALVDQKITESSAGVGAAGVRWATAMREAKTKKKVDTKASKGRKLRYQVHEKLQNFMAPNPTISWQENQIDELFSSLLGQRARVQEGSDEESEDELLDDGLRLFRA